MRRAADRRRPPGLRARPQPAAYGGHARHRVDDEPRRARRARLRLVEEPVGRPRRRGARAGPGRPARCSPCASCWRRSPTTTAGSSSRSRPSTPRATAGWSSGASSRRSTTSGGTGPGSPARVMSFSFNAVSRVRRLAPDLDVVMLVEKAHHWPMLRPLVGDDWIIGSGHQGAARAPRARPAPGQGRARDPRVDGQHRGRPADSASTSASPRSSATGRRYMLELLGR